MTDEEILKTCGADDPVVADTWTGDGNILIFHASTAKIAATIERVRAETREECVAITKDYCLGCRRKKEIVYFWGRTPGYIVDGVSLPCAATRIASLDVPAHMGPLVFSPPVCDADNKERK